MEKKDLEAAEELAERSIDLLEANTSISSYYTAVLAHVYRAQGLIKKAIDTLTDVIETQKRTISTSKEDVIANKCF